MRFLLSIARVSRTKNTTCQKQNSNPFWELYLVSHNMVHTNQSYPDFLYYLHRVELGHIRQSCDYMQLTRLYDQNSQQDYLHNLPSEQPLLEYLDWGNWLDSPYSEQPKLPLCHPYELHWPNRIYFGQPISFDRWKFQMNY